MEVLKFIMQDKPLEIQNYNQMTDDNLLKLIQNR